MFLNHTLSPRRLERLSAIKTLWPPDHTGTVTTLSRLPCSGGRGRGGGVCASCYSLEENIQEDVAPTMDEAAVDGKKSFLR